MKTPGETNLDVLMASMQPDLHDPVYVFVTVDPGYELGTVQPVMMFREREGLTLIVEQGQAAKAALVAEFPCRMITLNIHSSLNAVGFLARISTHLAALDMGVNPVSGYYHDHLFVPVERADDALAALVDLTRQVSI